MSYQVLARKYRPKNFDTLVGQEHVVRALSHALETGRLHHAYLFTGTRGVGKTTLSRILAKSLNCIGPDGNGGITATPCGVCQACTAIDAGRFVDYIEMDAASNRGVDEMAQLLEQAVYAPSNARFKVYMIDEVHMLTNHAFNSMLKTLEEPPPHVKFILATTDPQKIPVTVLSRCLQFNLKQMPPGHIVSHLDNILGQEGISFEQGALRLLAQGAHGSMRDALSLTDQAIAYAAGEVTLEAVQGMLGALDQSYLVRLLDALANQDGADLLAVADEMASRSLSYNGALQDLGTLLHRIALAQSVPGAVPQDLPELADIMRLAESFDTQEVQLFYQIVVHGRNEMGLAPDEYAGFTMTLLRMLAFRPGNGGADGVAPAGPGSARPAVPRPAGAGPTPARAAAAAAASYAAVAPAPRPVATPVQPQAAASVHAGQGQAAVHAVQLNTVPAANAPGSAWAAAPASSAAPVPASSAAPASSGQRESFAAPAPSAAQESSAAPASSSAPHESSAADDSSESSVPNESLAPQESTAALAPASAPTAAASASAPAAGEGPPWSSAPSQTAAPARGGPAPAPVQLAAAPAPSMNTARAAINAALEAARSASRGQNVAPKRPTAMSNQAAATAAQSVAPSTAAPGAPAQAPAISPSDPASAQDANTAASPPSARSLPGSSSPAPATPNPAFGAAAQQRPTAQPWEQASDDMDDATSDEPPSWVTEFSDDSAVAQAMPAAAPQQTPAASARPGAPASRPASASHAAPAAATPIAVPRAPAKAPYEYVITPVPQLDWDGNWPALAATLPLRGVAQQLALQTELVACSSEDKVAKFRLRAPIDTLRASGNTEKLTDAVQERFPNAKVVLDIDIGPVWFTAGVEAQAQRERAMREAEALVNADPFVQSMMRELGAFVVPGSVRPASGAAA